MTYSHLFEHSIQKAKGLTLDFQLLLEIAFNLTRTQFWIKKNDRITDKTALRKFYRWRQRLMAGEPVAHILKEKEFYGESFYVNKHVLIPRPETEILVEKAVEFIQQPVQILDIGSGSGVIAIMVAKLTGSTVTAVENSPKALSVLKKNVSRHQMSQLVFPIDSDLFPPLGAKYSMILSNPPYIPEHEWQQLDPTVRDFEPKSALAAGNDGLDIIRIIAHRAPSFLTPDGILMMEIGYNQKEQVREILSGAGFKHISFFLDYSHIPRIVHARLDSTESQKKKDVNT